MDDGLKQRLVGAVVLTSVAVLFLPSLFNEESRRRVDTRTQVPPRPDIKPVQIDSPVRPQSIPQAKAPEQMYRLVEPEPEVTPEPETTPEPEATRKSQSPGLDSEGVPLAWVVQVASFKTAERADKLRDELLSEGYKAYTRSLKTSKGEATRVYVGPKVDKQQALDIKEELDRAHKVDAMVLRFRP